MKNWEIGILIGSGIAGIAGVGCIFYDEIKGFVNRLFGSAPATDKTEDRV